MGYDLNDCWMTCGERDARCAALGIEDPFAEIERLRAQMKIIADQNVSDEMDDDQREHADFQGGYDRIVMAARDCMASTIQQIEDSAK